MTDPYADEIAVFAKFRNNLGGASHEVESALRELIYEYSTPNRENRFVVGGAAEIIVAAAMRSAGVDTDNLGHAGEGADLATFVNALGKRFSIKAVFSRRSSSTRLVNFLGGGGDRKWVDPTLFVLPAIGIVLGHPGHAALNSAVKVRDDALEMPLRAVREHARQYPDCVIALNIPFDPGTGKRVASVDVAMSILSKPHYPILGSMLQPDDPVDRLMKLEQMLERGNLSPEEFASAKRRVLG